jgi:hypothetical protein
VVTAALSDPYTSDLVKAKLTTAEAANASSAAGR